MSAEQAIMDQFHKLYYNSYVWRNNSFWLGVPTQKCPLDLWIYQELLFELKPDLIIESGTANGGSALFLASICDLVGKGRVVTIDIKDAPNRPNHKRITYLAGSSITKVIVKQIKGLIKEGDKIMVILDSDHRKEHVLTEMRVYSGLVTKGSYLIVEDTNINGHPVYPKFGPGPLEAVQEFLAENKNFVIDKSREKLFLSFNPNGYLKKIR